MDHPASHAQPAPPPLPRPAPPRPRSGAGWKIAVLVLAVGLCLSLLGNFLGLLGTLFTASSLPGREGRIPLEEIVLEDRGARRKIAVVPVEGIIMGGAVAGGSGLVALIEEQLKRAARDGNVMAVILKIDSPGGEVLASDNIFKAVQEFQETHGKPVIATMGSVAASGGYYVAAPCRWIVANELTITGSIGVIMQAYNYHQLMDKVGVRAEVFKSGKYKDMMSATKSKEEITDQERAMVQDLVDETFLRFKEVVAQGRARARQYQLAELDTTGRPLIENWNDYADGRIFSGSDAFEYGFVDELGNFDAAYQRALTMTGLESANLVQYRPLFSFGNFFRLFGQAGQSATPTVKVDLGVSPSIIEPGRLYFLSPHYVR